MINAEELYIVNYCHPNCIPLKNIVRLPKEEAFALAGKMAAANAGKTAFGRFEDFENYYPLRIAQDRYLYETFISLGGRPVEEHPLSFVLHGSEYLDEWFDHGIVTKILLCDIPSEYISFTFGDSGAAFQKVGGIEVLTKEMLLKQLWEYSGTLDGFLRDVVRRHYVEVQVWNDACCVK